MRHIAAGSASPPRSFVLPTLCLVSIDDADRKRAHMHTAESHIEGSETASREDARVRRLCSADRAAVLAHLQALSAQDQEMRFGCAMSRSAIARYVDGLDFGQDVALAVEDAAGHVIGMAQILPLGSAAVAAEIAFSVLPASRRRGLGHCLMQAVCGHAQRCGLRRLVAQVRSCNRPMLCVFQRAGMRLQRDSDEVLGVLEVGSDAAG